jgi:phage shock protein C
MSEPLYRSRHDRMIAGVAGGLAERLGVDSSVVRIAWVILVLPTGFLAVLAYVVMALVVPDEDEVFREPPTSTGGRAWPPPPFPQQPQTGPSQSGAAMPGAPAPGSPGLVPPMGTLAPSPVPPPPVDDGRRARRHARRAERRSRRPGAASFIVGGSLIVLGTWFLIREYVPALDMSRFWPVAVVGFGILLVLLALGQRSDGRGGDHG